MTMMISPWFFWLDALLLSNLLPICARKRRNWLNSIQIGCMCVLFGSLYILYFYKLRVSFTQKFMFFTISWLWLCKSYSHVCILCCFFYFNYNLLPLHAWSITHVKWIKTKRYDKNLYETIGRSVCVY